MHISFALIAILSFLSAAGLAAFTPHTLAAVHLAFAVGIMPLILSSMSFFAPVLTRSRPATRAVALFPALALAGGVMVVIAFLTSVSLDAIATAAVTALLGAIGLLVWMAQRARRAIGPPHPSLYWYLAALGFLALGLTAMALSPLAPERFSALRRLHLHTNLFGFVALTAFATLQVLLPTVAQKPDADAGTRLRRHLPVCVAGSLALVLGSVWSMWLSLLGLSLWAGPIAAVLRAWWREFRAQIFDIHGATPLLAAALVGFSAVLVTGALHGFGVVPSQVPLYLFVVSFLFPIVTGATAHLAVLWCAPGASHAQQLAAWQRLGHNGGLRAVTLMMAGGLSATHLTSSLLLAGAVLLWSALTLVLGLRELRAAHQ